MLDPDDHPDDELLAAVAMDDLDDVPDRVNAHVAACLQCSRAVDGLRRTFLRVRATAQPHTPIPAPHLWVDVSRQVQESWTEDRGRQQPPEVNAATRARGVRRLRSAPVVAAAVLVALVLGGAVGVVWGRASAPPARPDRDALVARAELRTLGGDDPRGLAEVVRHGGNVELRVWGAHLGDGRGTHEVWLLNQDGSKLFALGVLGRGESGTFVVPARLLAEGYDIVDVSLEPDDGDPAHSGDSVARGLLRHA